MSGTVVTFYSYKGGVGRSFTLANVAILLARWGYRVLAIDWDLEAPGLHHYFAPLMAEPPAAGVIDLAEDFAAGAVRPATAYATPLSTGEEGVVDLIAAGRQRPEYVSQVQGLDWAALYEDGFADRLEECRAEWTAGYDYVLIDSRTGISDIASICTAHLPDRLVLVFTANEQSVQGAVDIARRADVARDRMPYDRAQLAVLPLLSRVDSRVEYERAVQWYRKCTELTKPLFRNWLVQNVSEAQMLRHLTLPYVSYWAFGEQLAVLEERSPSVDQISFALETVAAIIAHRFDRTDLLADNRDAYVAAARAPEPGFDLDVRVSSPRSALGLAKDLVGELEELGVNARRSLSGDPGFLDKARDSAQHLCLIVDGQVSRWQVAEAERFLRHGLGATRDRRLFLVLTGTAQPENLPSFLRNLRYLRLSSAEGPRDVARELVIQVTGTGSVRDAEGERHAYRTAAAVLGALLNRPLPGARWSLVEQTVLAMTDAFLVDDTGSLRDLTMGLELASRLHGPPRVPSPACVEAPRDVRVLVADLITSLELRFCG